MDEHTELDETLDGALENLATQDPPEADKVLPSRNDERIEKAERRAWDQAHALAQRVGMAPRVYRIEDAEYIAAYSAEQAKQFYIRETGVNPWEDRPEEALEPQEMSLEQMERMRFVYDEEGEETTSWSTRLLHLIWSPGHTFPCLFAVDPHYL